MSTVAEGRIDVHAHSVLSAYRTALEAAALPNIRLPEWSPELALETMDRHGIAAAVTSLSVPGTHLGDDREAQALARACNEEAAAMTAAHPRLGAFATLPLPNVELACEEAIHALDVLKLDGVGLLAGYEGKYLGHPDYDPLLEVLDERSAVVPIHPAVHPSTQLVSLGVPNFVLEYPFDTTRAAVNLLFANALERVPGIKFVLSHGGGTLPFLAWRIAAVATWQLAHPPAVERFLRDRFPTALIEQHDELTPDHVLSLLGRFWFDTALVPHHGAMAALRALAQPERILFGSDWPYAYETFVEDEVRRLADVGASSERERSAVARDNALALFPRLRAISDRRPAETTGARA